MKDNSTLKSKISSYLTIAGGITTVAGGVNAQVVYTDVNPDKILTGHMSAYSLDLNNDATSDFNLVTIDSSIYGSYHTMTSNLMYYAWDADGAAISNSANSNSWLVGSPEISPLPLMQGNLIDGAGSFFSYMASGTFSAGAPIAAKAYSFTSFMGSSNSYTNYMGSFTAGQEGFIGLKFQIGSDTHYGWARVEVTSGYDTLIIKDYAYQATPDSSILAGDTSSGFVGIQELENDVLISNYNNNVQIKLNGELKNAQLKITNISGQQILSKELNSEVEMISMDEFASGIYLATVFSDKGTITKRVYIR